MMSAVALGPPGIIDGTDNKHTRRTTNTPNVPNVSEEDGRRYLVLSFIKEGGNTLYHVIRKEPIAACRLIGVTLSLSHPAVEADDSTNTLPAAPTDPEDRRER